MDIRGALNEMLRAVVHGHIRWGGGGGGWARLTRSKRHRGAINSIYGRALAAGGASTPKDRSTMSLTQQYRCILAGIYICLLRRVAAMLPTCVSLSNLFLYYVPCVLLAGGLNSNGGANSHNLVNALFHYMHLPSKEHAFQGM